MKKIFVLLIALLLVIQISIPICALGSPATDGAYNPPPSPSSSVYTGSFSLMRSYANVTTILNYNATQSNSAVVNGSNVAYYPSFLFSTPDAIVAPSTNGFGNVTDYSQVVQFNNGYALRDVTGSTKYYSIPQSTVPQFVPDGAIGNSYLYSYAMPVASTRYAYQSGIVTGEWLNSESVEDVVTGYAIKWSADVAMTVSLKGKLVYGVEGSDPLISNLDRNYTVAAGSIFFLNPQSLLQSDLSVDYDYYVFTGNWTVYAEGTGYLIEYKAYDHANVETVDYISGYNEYTEQLYSIDLYPVARISNKLSTSSGGGINPEGTLTVNSAGVHDVSNYQYIDIQIPPISMYYNGDIENGTYQQTLTQAGVTASILMDVYNTYERGSRVDITNNGEKNIGRYEFADVDVPQTVLEDVNAFNWLFGAVNGLLQMEILPGFSLGGILLFMAGLALLIWILKIFLGG